VTIHLPDVSEFQPNVDWAKVNKSNGGAAIIRAAYGTSHLDHAWYGGARRKDFWSHGGKVLGIYQYLVADQDPVAQARALRKIVGKLQPGEFLVCDLEEGGGDQAHRFHAWADELSDLVYPGYQGHWLYSSSYFFQAHGLMPIAHSKTHTWVAAYGSIEPSVPHSLWQYTSTGVVPGIPSHCDVNAFKGSAADLAALVHHGADPAPAKPTKPTKPPAVRHPFKRLEVDGDLGPMTVSALNYWLGTPGQGARVTTRTIESLQHHVGATVDGAWGKNNCALQGARCESQTTRRLQAFLNHHGAKPKAPNTGTLGGPTIKALQRFLNQKVGLYT
jgi:GH25 family lysozyme M1 (1,4-beta-N-acetylmuramidase)